MFELVELDYATYRGQSLEFFYRTKHYLDIESVTNIDGRIFKLARKAFFSEIEKSFVTKLGAAHLSAPRLVAAKTADILKGYIETDYEDWNNRLRITNLLILPPYRGQEIGSFLLQHVIDYAKNIGARSIVLETQSCNTPAMSFYAQHGFDVIGFDLTYYGNNDVEQREFRIEMGLPLV